VVSFERVLKYAGVSLVVLQAASKMIENKITIEYFALKYSEGRIKNNENNCIMKKGYKIYSCIGRGIGFKIR